MRARITRNRRSLMRGGQVFPNRRKDRRSNLLSDLVPSMQRGTSGQRRVRRAEVAAEQARVAASDLAARLGETIDADIAAHLGRRRSYEESR